MTDAARPPDLAAFSLDLLAGSTRPTARIAPLAVDPDGHLVVAGRTRWRPVRFDPSGRSVLCARVDQPSERRPT